MIQIIDAFFVKSTCMVIVVMELALFAVEELRLYYIRIHEVVPEQVAKEIARQTLLGIKNIHESNIVHRDIKVYLTYQILTSRVKML